MNADRFDLTSLRLFVAVVEAGSLTEAARACALSLPAVSKRIRELEALVGVQLLHRSRAGVVPSPAGNTLYQHALQVSADLAQLSLAMGDYRGDIQGHVRVCANTSAVTGFLPGFLSDYLQARPEVKIDLEEANSEPLVRAVEAGKADLGIFAGNVPAGNLRTDVCDVDSLVLVVPRDHVLAGARRARWADALRHDIVGFNRGSAFMRLMDAESERLGLPLKLRVQVKSFDAMCQMVARGIGLGLLSQGPARMLSRALPVALVPLDEPWARERTLLVGWRADAALGRHARIFLEQLRARVPAPARARLQRRA